MQYNYNFLSPSVLPLSSPLFYTMFIFFPSCFPLSYSVSLISCMLPSLGSLFLSVHVMYILFLLFLSFLPYLVFLPFFLTCLYIFLRCYKYIYILASQMPTHTHTHTLRLSSFCLSFLVSFGALFLFPHYFLLSHHFHFCVLPHYLLSFFISQLHDLYRCFLITSLVLSSIFPLLILFIFIIL